MHTVMFALPQMMRPHGYVRNARYKRCKPSRSDYGSVSSEIATMGTSPVNASSKGHAGSTHLMSASRLRMMRARRSTDRPPSRPKSRKTVDHCMMMVEGEQHEHVRHAGVSTSACAVLACAVRSLWPGRLAVASMEAAGLVASGPEHRGVGNDEVYIGFVAVTKVTQRHIR